MCKILVMAGLKPENADANWEFITRMGKEMSFSNRDGLGYTAVDKEGKMFGERWHVNEEAFILRPNGAIVKKLSKYKDFVEGDIVPMTGSYNRFGSLTSQITAITLHTRYATSGKEFDNTHPFVDLEKDTSVIHNGVIQNVTKEDNIRSTCDSERILNRYLARKVNTNPDNIQKMVNDLKGYFACGIITRDGEGKRVLDVFKSRASLFFCYIRELDCVVITTDDGNVRSVANELGLTVTNKMKVHEDRHMRLDALTGEVMFVKPYNDTANTHTNHTPSNYLHRATERIISEADWQDAEGLHDRAVSETKEIINRIDPMNEGKAKENDYNLTGEGIWIKSNKKVN